MSVSLARKWTLCVLVVSVSSVLFAATGNPLVLGQLINSSGATLDGEAVPVQSTITEGDVLSTKKGGSAVVTFSAGAEASLAENTVVRFSSGVDHLSMRLSSGTVGAKSQGKGALIVETPEYIIKPVEHGGAVYLVAMLSDKTTVVAARHGQVAITEATSGQTYVVSAGHYAKVSGLPSAVPDPGTGAGATTHGVLHALLQSPKALIIVATGAGIGVGLGVGQAFLGTSPASPSQP